MTAAPEFSAFHVLVIDDQPHVAKYVGKVLASMGVTHVAVANDGQEALAAVTAAGGWFDLILCDLNMPERDGIETIRAFAALGLESAIAITSVEEERVIRTAGMLADAQGLRLVGAVQKPVNAEKLEPILRRVLEVPGAAPATDAPPEAQEFEAAFANGAFSFQFQPRVVMRTGKFDGVEAFLRWKHPARGPLHADAFVGALLADDRRAGKLDDLVMRSAIACAGRAKEVERDLPVSVNVSARAFDRYDFPERLDALARDVGIPAKHVTIEVPETSVEKDAVRLIDVAARLRLKGFHLAMDRFGTGHSTLSSLQRLPFDVLKLDRSVVHGCATTPAQRSLVEAALTIARNLQMTSVAVGVQHRPDWDLLAELGCDMVQGWLIARPMTEEGLEAWAAQWNLR
ncbi:MAG: EAL domain-containing response regulator [Gemmatimonadota bacterium]|nr:EAL domain-containing response regulator [Gemmatimonadota bacterium]